MFHKKGDIIIPKSAATEDDLMNVILETGGEDLNDDGENWEILTATSAYEGMLEALKKAGIEPASSSVGMIPRTTSSLKTQATTMIRLMEALEDHDDVQNVHSNFDIDQKLLEEVAGRLREKPLTVSIAMASQKDVRQSQHCSFVFFAIFARSWQLCG